MANNFVSLINNFMIMVNNIIDIDINSFEMVDYYGR